jgi:hypothetical protein
MVVRLLWLSLICAQNPKSAVQFVRFGVILPTWGLHTQLDIAFLGKQNVVRLDIAVNYALGVQVL